MALDNWNWRIIAIAQPCLCFIYILLVHKFIWVKNYVKAYNRGFLDAKELYKKVEE